ncbi:MAG: hypothetical protein PHO36_16275 [Parabacteroides sp.]|nr:hypothetical protein [Parabacteroides sp.]
MREGSGNRDRMISLSLRTSKFATLLTYLWLIPLYIELDYLLALWFKDVPEYAGTFCRIILIIYAISNFTTGLGSAVLAAGIVKEYQRAQGVVLLLTFPLMWIVYELGGSPVQALLVMLSTGVFHTLGCVYWAKKLLNVAYSRWIKAVFIKSIVVLIFPILLSIILNQSMQSSFIFLVLLSVANFICVCSFSWLFALDKSEKEFMKLKIYKIIRLSCDFIG